MADEQTQDVSDVVKAAAEPKAEETETATEETAEDEWKAPSREEFDAIQKSLNELGDKLKKANNESASRRQKIKELEKQSETDVDKVAREAREAAEAELKPTMVRAIAKSALLEAEARTDRVGALSKLIDMSAIGLENGEVVGIEDQVAALRSEYPEFFGAAKEKVAAPPVPRVESGKRKSTEEKPLTPGEQIAKMFQGRA